MMRTFHTRLFIGIALALLLTPLLFVLGAGPYPALDTQATARMGTSVAGNNATSTSAYLMADMQTATGVVNPGACPPSGQWTAPGVDGSEHGDAPPQWIADAGYRVCFMGDFNTSPAENVQKHGAMKGFSMPNLGGTGQDVYVRYHAASNPGDRSARFHSYETFIRDTARKVSHFVGWVDTGDPAPYPAGARVPRLQFGDPGIRPVILVVDHASSNANVGCEQWYVAAASDVSDWSPGPGSITICGSTTFYALTENSNPDIYNPATWDQNPATLGLQRRDEFTYYANHDARRGDFYTDQFGYSLSGPNDPKIGTQVVEYGKSYTVIALKQTVQPTIKSITFPNNAVEKVFSCNASCHLPN